MKYQIARAACVGMCFAISITYVSLHAQTTPTQQVPASDGGDFDFVVPSGLDSHVASSDLIVVARLIRPLDLRIQTTMEQARGKAVPYTLTCAQYLMSVERVIKAPAGVEFDGQRVIERAVCGSSLMDAQRGLPDLAGAELLLFLNYYPPAKTYQVGAWEYQFKKTEGGSVVSVRGRPAATFLQEAPALRAGVEGARTASDWTNFVQQVEGVAARSGKN